jgi:Na+/H+ antiporter NhaD/arsenite permease-like protein
MIDDYDRVRPPKGWLVGVVLTILIIWAVGVFWESFWAHEISRVSLAGAAIMILGAVLRAHQALTNNDYRTAKETIIARRYLLPLGIFIYIVGRQFSP